MIMFKYSINLIWSDEDESYIATIPEFPALAVFGKTPEEAVVEAKIAASGFIKEYDEEGRIIPEPILWGKEFRIKTVSGKKIYYYKMFDSSEEFEDWQEKNEDVCISSMFPITTSKRVFSGTSEVSIYGVFCVYWRG